MDVSKGPGSRAFRVFIQFDMASGAPVVPCEHVSRSHWSYGADSATNLWRIKPTQCENKKLVGNQVLLVLVEVLDPALLECRISPVFPFLQANICILFVADALGAPS